MTQAYETKLPRVILWHMFYYTYTWWNEGEGWVTVVPRDISQLDVDVGRVRFREMDYVNWIRTS